MYEKPLEKPSFFFEKDQNKKNDQHIISESKIERMLSSVRNDLYPKQPEIIFGGNLIYYCIIFYLGDFTRTIKGKEPVFLFSSVNFLKVYLSANSIFSLFVLLFSSL